MTTAGSAATHRAGGPKPTPGPKNARALAFIRDAVARHGRPASDGVVHIECSQAALAAEAGCSAGTVAYYLRCLGPGVVARRGALFVDSALLGGDEVCERSGRRLYLVGPPTPKQPLGPMPGELIAPIATALVALGHALAQVGTELARVAGANPRTDPANFADSREDSANVAGSNSTKNSQEDRKSLPSCLQSREPTREVRGFRGKEASADEPATVGRRQRLSDDDAIAQAIAPLVAACEARGAPAVLDRDGRHWLGLYSPPELSRGVTNVLRELNCTNLSRPLGLLVWKARYDEDFFASPPQSSVSPPVVLAEEPETTDDEAAAAVAAMSSDELVVLDALVRQRLRIGRLIDEVFADAEALAHQRCWAWRAHQGQRPVY